MGHIVKDIIVILFITIVMAYIINKTLNNSLKTEIKIISNKIKNLEKKIYELQNKNIDNNKFNSNKNEYIEKQNITTEIFNTTENSNLKEEQTVPLIQKNPIIKTISQESIFKPILKKLETQMAGNITGVVGTLLIVLGAIFLGIYAAIKLDPIGRFIVICTFSNSLYILYYFLNKKMFWKNISLWLRSGSGVIFLIGCIGSIGIDTLKWVNNPVLAICLLSFGLIINLTFGFLNGGALFASIHVTFCFLAMSLLPANLATFILASLLAFFGILMSFKNRHWDKHIIVTTIGFTVLHFYWLYFFKTPTQEFPVKSIIAIIFCLSIGGIGIASHYKKTYQTTKIESIPLLAHIITWVCLGINILAHSQGSSWSPIFLTIASISAFSISIHANRIGILWLYICDRIISLLLILFAELSLRKFGLSVFEISIISAVTSAVFLRMSLYSIEKTIFKISNIILLAFYSFIALQTFDMSINGQINQVSNLFMLFFSFLILIYLIGLKFYYKNIKYNFTYIEIPIAIHGLMAFFIIINTTNEWLLIVPIIMSTITIITRNYLKNILLDFSVLLSTFILVCLEAFLLFNRSNTTLYDVILCSGIFILGIFSFKFCNWNNDKKLTWPGVGIIWLAITLASYWFTKDIASILPGFLWLLISLISIELMNYKKIIPADSNKHSQTHIYIGILGLTSLLLYFIRYFLIDMSNETLVLGFIKLRMFSEFISVIILIYWIIMTKNIQNKLLKIPATYLLEASILIGITCIFYEVSGLYYPVILSILSFCIYFIGKHVLEFNRLIIYSYISYFSSLCYIALISSTAKSPTNKFFDQEWVLGLLSIFINTAFMIFIYRDKDSLINLKIYFPPLLKILILLKNLIDKYEIKVILYPIFAAVGFFLYWTFDKSILSIMWVLECFILFIISIFLRESQFRVVSMIGIGIIFLRIIFYDLTGVNFFIKAIVFILVGIILVTINIIYNKYRYRYETKK